MHAGRIVFTQLMDFFPTHEFNRCVRRYRGNYKARRFSCRDQFLCMAFAQLTGRESLRDMSIRLCGPKSSTRYPDLLRRISYYADDIGRRFVFLTNNFTLPALTIAELYKSRWQVELFFKWIKQHLRIKAFYGTSINTVKTQVWIAVCVYVLVAIVKKEPTIDRSMGEILQILSITLFEKTPLFAGVFAQCLHDNKRPRS